MTYQFDHLVLIARDQILAISDRLAGLGFNLTPLSKHNLGSSNQLCMLDSTYLEVLGWEPGTTPKRKEIADLGIGLDALVFKTDDAEQCFKRLQEAGFEPNPIQDLSRPAQVNENIHTALFKTVRFSVQPVAGLRIYFCQHLTPEYLWFDEVTKHPNKKNHLQEIVIASPDPRHTANLFLRLLHITALQDMENSEFIVDLGNCILRIKSRASLTLPQIEEVRLNTISNSIKQSPDGTSEDLFINRDFFANWYLDN
jgi:hypothetical protein